MRRFVTVTLLALALAGCSQVPGKGSANTYVGGGFSTSPTTAQSSQKAATTSASPTSRRPVEPSAPAGFNPTGESGLYYKWSTDSSTDCGYYDVCWSMDVYSDTGCPGGVYIELSIETDDGTAVDWTNGTLSLLRSESKGNIVMGKAGESRGKKARLAKASCYGG